MSFLEPADGDAVSSPVRVRMEARGIAIKSAGPVAENSGHFHVMVDVGCVKEGEAIPVASPGFNHFGHAQTSAELPLEPGRHTLCLQVGDGKHVARPETDKITVTVR